MKKLPQTFFFVFVGLVTILCATIPIMTFDENEQVLFGYTLNELQAYIYFGSSGIIAFLVIQYGIALYKKRNDDETDYEQYSNIVLDDNSPEPIEKR